MNTPTCCLCGEEMTDGLGTHLIWDCASLKRTRHLHHFAVTCPCGHEWSTCDNERMRLTSGSSGQRHYSGDETVEDHILRALREGDL